MKTVFISGSQSIRTLNDKERQYLHKIIQSNYEIVIGDANGVDAAVQDELSRLKYPNTTVYYSGEVCRTQSEFWQQVRIINDPALTGRERHIQKDKEMAKNCDYGMVIWDGKSPGSFGNVIELLRLKKSAQVLFRPKNILHVIRCYADAMHLLALCDSRAIKYLQNTLDLSGLNMQET